LFFAVSAAYEDIISELELNILQDPSIEHSKQLYILQSELTLLRNNLSPVASVIAALRDHRKGDGDALPLDAAAQNRGIAGKPPLVPSTSANIVATQTVLSSSGSDVTTVSISPLARTYLKDVEDHCLLILQNIDTLRGAAGNMISLIYNQMSAIQNETMAVLTYVTIFFLPLTFLTGYFGMNFTDFDAIHNSDTFFWKIAVPVMVFTFVLLSAGRLQRVVTRVMQRIWIRRTKQSRREQLSLLFKSRRQK
jgi:Mg2+ and Co2+ transporter CorA